MPMYQLNRYLMFHYYRIISTCFLLGLVISANAQLKYDAELIPKPSIHKTAKVLYLRMLDNGILTMVNSGKQFAFDGNKFFQLDGNETHSGIELANFGALCKTTNGSFLTTTLNSVYELDSNLYFKKVDKLSQTSDPHFKMSREEFCNFTVYHYTNYWNLSLEFAKLNRTSGYFMKGDSMYFYKNGYETFLTRVKMLPQAEISNGVKMYLFTNEKIYHFNNGRLVKEYREINLDGKKIRPSDIYRVFYCNSKFYLLGTFGLAKLHITNSGLFASKLVNSETIRSTAVYDMSITKDEKIIYFTSDSGLYRYTRQWAEFFTSNNPEVRSSNSLLKEGDFIYANRGGKYALDGKFYEAPESKLEYYGCGYAYDKFGNIYYSLGDSVLVRDRKGKLLSWAERKKGFCSYVPSPGKVHLIYNDSIYEQTANGFKPSRYLLPTYLGHAFNYGGVFYKDKFYVASIHGLLIFDKESGKRLYHLEKIKDPVYKVQIAPNLEGVFIFTYGLGIWFYDGTNYHRLPNDKENHMSVAHSLRLDREGRAWIPTNSAMIVCNYEDIRNFLLKKTTGPEYTIIKDIAGIKEPEFNGRSDSSSIYVPTDTSFWYCTVFGVLKLYPERFSTQQLLGHPTIARSIVDGKFYSGFYLPTGHHQQYRMELLIPVASKSFIPRIEFSLNGEEWIEAENGQIQFARSKAGAQKLILRYKYYSTDNFYTYRTYAFNIEPFWYEMLWAKVIGVFALFFVFGLILKFREYRLVRRQVELKRMVREKTKALSESLENLSNSQLQLQESDAFKERLIRVLAHDIRSPLMSAFYVSEYMQKQLEKSDADPELLEMSREVKQVVKSLHDYSNDFISWYNLMRGNSQITYKKLYLKETLSLVLKFYDSAFKSNNNIVRLIGLEDEKEILCDHNILQIIFRNLVDNANKYSSNNEIIISIKEHEDSIEVCFRNIAEELSDKRKMEMLESLNQEPGLLVPIEGQKLGLTMLNYFCKKLDLDLQLNFAARHQVIFCVNLKKSR